MKKPKQTPTSKQKRSKILFPRRVTVPARVQASSELWLEMFMGFCDGILARYDDDDDGDRGTKVHALSLTEQARELADAALHQFEDRWPEVKL